MPTSNPYMNAYAAITAAGDGAITLTAQGNGTVNGIAQTNFQFKGILVGINITAITAGSLTVTIQGIDPMAPTAVYTVLASAALATTGYTTLTVYPNLAASANVSVNNVMPANYRIVATVATGPVTATISTTLIP